MLTTERLKVKHILVIFQQVMKTYTKGSKATLQTCNRSKMLYGCQLHTLNVNLKVDGKI